MNTERKQLVEQLFARRRQDYRDTTRRITVKAIEKRVAALRRRMESVPEPERNSDNSHCKKDWLEHRLLEFKRAIYAPNAPLLLELTLARFKLQLSDSREGSLAERHACRDDQLKQLLYLSLLSTDIEELRRQAIG
jgi:hypothetical protein